MNIFNIYLNLQKRDIRNWYIWIPSKGVYSIVNILRLLYKIWDPILDEEYFEDLDYPPQNTTPWKNTWIFLWRRPYLWKNPFSYYINSSQKSELDGPYCWDSDEEYFVGKPLFDDEMENGSMYPFHEEINNHNFGDPIYDSYIEEYHEEPKYLEPIEKPSIHSTRYPRTKIIHVKDVCRLL